MKSTALLRQVPLTLIFSLAGVAVAPDAHAQPAEPAPEEPTAEPDVETEAEVPPPPADPAPAPPPPETAPVAPAAVEPAPAPDPEPAPPAAPPPPEPMPEPEAVPAAPAFPISVAGSFWSRYELRDGYADHGLTHPRLHREGDTIVSRARLVIKTAPADLGNGMTASATIAPQAAYTMGETGAPATIGDDPPVQLYEGYASIGGNTARVDTGRFMMDYGDALVIGNLGWNETARSFNGARLHLTPNASPLYIDAFGTLITEGRTSTQEVVRGDVYFLGVYAGLGPVLGEGSEVDLYFLDQATARNETVALADPMDPTVTVEGELEPAHDMTLGARVKGKASLLDYRAEAGVQFGKSPVNPTFANLDPEAADKLAYQGDVELGISPAKGFRISVEGLYASGNDLETTDKNEGWNELYPTGHKFLGLADVVGARTNVLSGVLHVQVNPVEPLKLSLDAHYFSRPEAGADGEDGSMGSEFDLNALYAFGGGASVRGMYALFLPTEAYWEPKSTSEDVAGDPIHYFEFQVSYDFK